MNKTHIFLVSFLFSIYFVNAQCSELFFSEYIEGSYNNKALEIYNPTSQTVDLGNYIISRYPNGSFSSEDMALSGVLPPGETWVVTNSDTNSTYQFGDVDNELFNMADQLAPLYPSPLYFNGDDAIALSKNGLIIDIIGKIGEDPGLGWTNDTTYGFTDFNGGDYLTRNITLVRKPEVSYGITTNPVLFNAAEQWTAYPMDDWSNLGIHLSECIEITENINCPNIIFSQDIPFNVWPDTSENLPYSYVDEYYETYIHIKAPDVIGDILGFPYNTQVGPFTLDISTLSLDSIQIVGIDGLPDFVTYNLANNGTIAANDQACIQLSGFPTQTNIGNYPITIKLNVWFAFPLMGTTSILDLDGSYFNIDGYNINVIADECIDTDGDGVCDDLEIPGCMDSLSINFNYQATDDDGSCISVVYGCTDSTAINFNPEANIDNGDCDYCLNFLNSSNDIVDYSCNDSQEFDTMDAIIENNPNTGSPHINLPIEICYTISPPSSGPHRSSWAKWGEYEYLPPQRWLHNLEHGGIAFLYHPCAEESVIDSLRNIACSIADDETGAFRWVLTPYPNLPSKISIVAWEWSYSKNSVDSDEIFTFISEHYRQAPEDFPYDGSYNDLYIGKCSNLIGCTDEDAENYNPNAIVDDGSCIEEHFHACEHEIEGLYVDNIIHNRVVFNWESPEENPSHYMIRYRAVGTSSWTVMTAGPVNSNEFTGTSRTRYFMEPGTTYEWNIRARVLNEDGSTNCQSAWSASNEYTTLDACANLENLSASTEAVWATLSADAPAAEWGVWQSKGKLRVVGTNSFRYVNGDSDGNISVLKGNFDPSTDYEWHTKAWCTGNVDSDGNSDPMYHSGWGDFSTFSTQAPCDKMPTNLTTAAANNAQTAITMSWDTPYSGAPDHYFLELTNVATGQVWAWNNIPGTDNSKSKYGLTAGEYSWRIRGACGTNGTSWATIFSQPVTYTLGGARLENSSFTNLDVYPNPSRGVFNVSFDLDNRQNVYLSITNYIGEVIFTEELKDQEGQYNKTIDLGKKANGIYILNITTNNQNINQKIVIQ